MILVSEAKGRCYGVVGLGKSGRATVASLLASGAEVVAWDDEEATRQALQKEFPLLNIAPVESWDYANLAALVMSPGIALAHPAVRAAEQHGVEVIGDVELLYRAQPHARYVGITGTNGKSTTTTLIAHVLHYCGVPVQAGGNLGVPALALEPFAEKGAYVLEMSSYQLDLVRRVRFDVAVLLNISPDHLDHHGSMDAYIAAKKRIFDRQSPDDCAILGVDDAPSRVLAERLMAGGIPQWVWPITVRRHGLDGMAQGVRVENGVLHDGASGAQYDLNGIASLQGEHNGQNAAAAYLACRAFGIPPEEIVAAMRSYAGLAHRMQWLGEHRGIRFVNDSKATNADAADKALNTYDGIYWIAGGVAKEGGIASLTQYFPKIRQAYLIGEAAKPFAQTLGDRVPTRLCGTLERAFAAATADAAKDTRRPVVLLSPACASFDQFANFERRGEAFIKLVEQFAQGDSHAATA